MCKSFETDYKSMIIFRLITIGIYGVVDIALFIISIVLRIASLDAAEDEVSLYMTLVSLINILIVFLTTEVMIGISAFIMKKTVKKVEIGEDYFKINDDTFYFTAGGDTYVVGTVGNPVLINSGCSLYAVDEMNELKKRYWFGPRLHKKSVQKRVEIMEALYKMMDEHSAKKADEVFRSLSSSESHIIVNFPVGKVQKDYLNGSIMMFAISLSFFIISLIFTTQTLYFLANFIMFILALVLGILSFRMYLQYQKSTVSSAEISLKGIRINNDLYSFEQNPEFSYVLHPASHDKMRLFDMYKNLIVKTADGSSKLYMLGPVHLCSDSQKLLALSLDRITRYVEAYGIPEK